MPLHISVWFHNHHSTNHALISITEKIRKNLDESKFACGVFLDFQKVFDTVNHKILLAKLQHYSVTGLSMNILHAGDKSPVQERFFKNSTGDLLPALRFLGGLYNFCNFVIILSLM